MSKFCSTLCIFIVAKNITRTTNASPIEGNANRQKKLARSKLHNLAQASWFPTKKAKNTIAKFQNICTFNFVILPCRR